MNDTGINIIKALPEQMDISNGSAIAIGNFDGFHLGHQRLMNTLKRIALGKNLLSLIVTFSPNPKVYFKKDLHLINSDEQRKQILLHQGVDHVCILDFSRVLHMPGEDFVREVLIRQLNMKYIVMGENFHFGKDRTGDIHTLEKLGHQYGFEHIVVNSLILDGIRISSSLIRQKLGDSEIESSNRMLGHRYYIDGIVVEGDKLGRQLGFPTINIATENEILPSGVFKTAVEFANLSYDAITYIGNKPTFNGREKKVETHIFNFQEEIYGQRVRLYFDRRLRNEQKFDSPQSLINQIKKDIATLNVDKNTFF